MNENNIIEELSTWIANEVPEVTHEELAQLINQEVNQDGLFELIKQKIDIFLKNVEDFEKISPGAGDIALKQKELESKKKLIYADFFIIQNLINTFIGQRIVMTYVHVDDYGKREIRIFDNSVKNLKVYTGISKWGNEYARLGYAVDNHYTLLKNSLPEEENESLQQTAAEVERRYLAYKKRVLWFYPDRWKGYKFYTKGPINEAFVNLYVHNIKLLNSVEGNIDEFLLGSYGAINADARKGYMIGDVSKDGIQYAVKGAFGSPQGTAEIIKEFKKLQKEFTREKFDLFIKKFTEDEMKRQLPSQIKELSKRSIGGIVGYYQDKLNQDIPIGLFES